MRKIFASLALLFSPSALLVAQQGQPGERWKALQFLVGDWVAEGGGAPGQATGSFSFKFDLQGGILVRRNQADYPASRTRPAFRHEDLMVIYPESDGKAMKAIYFDNEGHVIHYVVGFSKDRNTAQFLSEPAAASPRFRLTYQKTNTEAVTVKFEMAPPGKPHAFSIYLDGVARRK